MKAIQGNALGRINKSKHSNSGLKETSFLKKCKEILDLFEKMKISDFEEKPLYNIEKYLQLMKLSLESPPKSHEHSLQKFLQVRTLTNMDKLFKHLFRTIILFLGGEDSHSHDLLALFALAEDFFHKRGISIDQDKAILKKINLKIAHHYLYKDSHASLQKKI